MPKFNKSNIAELQSFLYSNSPDHDAIIERVNCDYENKSIRVSLFNPYFNAKADYTFHTVEFALSIKGNWHGNRQEVIGVAAENFSYLEKYLPNYREYTEDSLYLLFQMFSGDELHIISKEVTIEVTD